MVTLDDRTGNILTTIAVYAAIAAAAYLARSTILVFLLALLLAYLLEPMVGALERLMDGRARGVAIAIVYAVFTGLLVLLGHLFGASVAWQIRRFVAAVPDIVARVEKALPAGHADLQSFVVNGVTGAVVTATREVAWLFLVPIVAIFFLGNRVGLLHGTVELFGRGRDVASAKRTVEQLDRALAEFTRAELTLATASALFYATAMAVLRCPYPLALGALGGALEFIPAFGWIVAAAAILVPSWAAGAHWIIMAVLIGVWRLVQNFVISPHVMGEHLQLNPMLALFAMMAGGQLLGLTGVLLSLPAVAVARVLWAQRRVNVTQAPVAFFKS